MLCVGSRESIINRLLLEHGNLRDRLHFLIVFFDSAVNAWQFLEGEFEARTRLTADFAGSSVHCGFEAFLGCFSAVATLSSGFFVFFPVKMIDKRNL